MPSARSATAAMRPTSPLSPRFEASQRYDSFPQSRQQNFSPRSPTSQQQRRKFGTSLTLPGLPRFHPANYPSSHSSFASTPASGPSSPHGPMSPILQQKVGGEAQTPLHAYQREYLPRPPSSSNNQKPVSPKLQPLGSPGPVTPLELEAADGYISLAKASSRSVMTDHPAELSQKLNQAARQREKLSRGTSGPLPR